MDVCYGKRRGSLFILSSHGLSALLVLHFMVPGTVFLRFGCVILTVWQDQEREGEGRETEEDLHDNAEDEETFCLFSGCR